MLKKNAIGALCLLFLSLLLATKSFPQEDKIIQMAIETIRIQMDLPKAMEIKFVEKKEGSIPEFYQLKFILVAKDREFPVIVNTDKTGENMIIEMKKNPDLQRLMGDSQNHH